MAIPAFSSIWSIWSPSGLGGGGGGGLYHYQMSQADPGPFLTALNPLPACFSIYPSAHPPPCDHPCDRPPPLPLVLVDGSKVPYAFALSTGPWYNKNNKTCQISLYVFLPIVAPFFYIQKEDAPLCCTHALMWTLIPGPGCMATRVHGFCNFFLQNERGSRESIGVEKESKPHL